jgi:hypothetical protein
MTETLTKFQAESETKVFDAKHRKTIANNMGKYRKSVEGGTLMKIQAFVDDEGNGSSVLFSGDWGLDGNGQIAMKAFAGMTMYSTMPIVFNGRGTTKPDVAFQHMVILAKQLDGKITYR